METELANSKNAMLSDISSEIKSPSFLDVSKFWGMPLHLVIYRYRSDRYQLLAFSECSG